MQVGICNLSVAPLRKTNAHRSEMVNQVLFAERFEIYEEVGEWAWVRMLEADYEGWLQRGQFLYFPQGYPHAAWEDDYLTVYRGGGLATYAKKKVSLVPGTKISRKLMERPESFFPYRIEGDLKVPCLDQFAVEFPLLMDHYLNSPYLWGGRTPLGIDCSGLSQIIYAQFGISLPRDAYQQAKKGWLVDAYSNFRQGDLAFFGNDEGRITHVGILVDSETIFHASANVRLDRIDERGIFNREENRYTHRLQMVKRLF